MPEGNTPVSSSSNSKTLYIVGGAIVLLVIAWIFMRFMGGAALGVAGVDTDRNLDGSTTYTNEEGSVTVGGNSMPENWPSDAPDNYAGASIQYSGNANPQTGEAGAVVMYNVNASAKAVADHYKAQLEAKGWTVSGTATMAGATTIGGTKDGRVFGVNIVDAGNGTAMVTAGLEI